MSTTQNVVTVRIVTDHLQSLHLLEARLYMTSDIDCQLLLESGNMRGLIDYETEVQLQHYTPFKATAFLGAEGRAMTPFEWASVFIAAIGAAAMVAQTIIQIIKKKGSED